MVCVAPLRSLPALSHLPPIQSLSPLDIFYPTYKRKKTHSHRKYTNETYAIEWHKWWKVLDAVICRRSGSFGAIYWNLRSSDRRLSWPQDQNNQQVLPFRIYIWMRSYAEVKVWVLCSKTCEVATVDFPDRAPHSSKNSLFSLFLLMDAVINPSERLVLYSENWEVTTVEFPDRVPHSEWEFLFFRIFYI